MNIEYDTIHECPFVVVDDFLDEYELSECWKTIDSLKISGLLGPKESGSALDYETLEPVKKNACVWLTDLYQRYPGLCPLMEVFVPKHADVRGELLSKHPAFRSLQEITYTMLASYYGNTDHYARHRDNSAVTTLFWLCKDEQKFTGGDLTLEESKTIEFKNNRLIMFPGYTYHEVSPIVMDPEDAELGFGRWTITMFSEPLENPPAQDL